MDNIQDLRETDANRRQQEFLQKFDKYLGRKLTNQQERESTSVLTINRKDIENELKRKKLVENTSEVRLQRLMDGFKALDTYVNVKSFLEEVNIVNQQAGFYRKRAHKSQEKTLEVI